MQPWYPVSESDAEDDFIRLNWSNEECFRALLAQKVGYPTSIHLIRPAWEHCRLVFIKSDRVGHTEYIGPWTTLARPSGAGPPYTQPPYTQWPLATLKTKGTYQSVKGVGGKAESYPIQPVLNCTHLL